MFFGERLPVGLDIGSGLIKAAQIKERKGKYELVRFEMVPLSPGMIAEDSIAEPAGVADAIKELIRKARIKENEAVISLSGSSSVVVELISLPDMPEDQLASTIKETAVEYIPFNINDVNVDFHIIGPGRDPGRMNVLLVAAKKSVINQYVSVVKEAGLTPVIIDADVFALHNMFEINYEATASRNIVLIDIGSASIKMNFVREGVLSFVREIPVGSSIHTEALQRDFNIPYETAERLKRGETVENIDDEEVAYTISSASGRIFAEIEHFLASIPAELFEEQGEEAGGYYVDTSHSEESLEIILAGGAALIPRFPEMLAENFNYEVKTVDPFQNIAIAKGLDDAFIRDIGPVTAVSVGLALRRIGDR